MPPVCRRKKTTPHPKSGQEDDWDDELHLSSGQQLESGLEVADMQNGFKKHQPVHPYKIPEPHLSCVAHSLLTSPVSSCSFFKTKQKHCCQTADTNKSYPAELFLRLITLLGLASCFIVEAVVADEAGSRRRWGWSGSAGEGEQERAQEEDWGPHGRDHPYRDHHADTWLEIVLWITLVLTFSKLVLFSPFSFSNILLYKLVIDVFVFCKSYNFNNTSKLIFK